MHIVLFCHSIRSDWNHGNAHFLRGVVGELQTRGHIVRVFEPGDGWSAAHLRAEAGEAALEQYHTSYPQLRPRVHAGPAPDLDEALDGADLVLVHEWSDPGLIAAVGARRKRGRRFALLFHDTHHRSVSRPGELQQLDLSGYDGVLAFGEVIRLAYERAGWAARAWTWHEAADTRVFRPRPPADTPADLVWIGNWGDDERTAELEAFLWTPASALGLTGSVHGVQYPPAALDRLARTGLTFRGRIANHEVPEAFARHRVTVHVPRRWYATELPGVPTIRVFEALACGIPLVSAPWPDIEGLFTPGRDFLVARSSADMTSRLRSLLSDPDERAELARAGLQTIAARHTCAHRVDELLAIVADVRGTAPCAAVSMKTAPRRDDGPRIM